MERYIAPLFSYVAPVTFTAIILAVLLGGHAVANTLAESPVRAIQMAGAADIALIDPEGYNLSVAEALEQVRDQERTQIISVALAEVRKKYPQLKLEDIELRDFSYRTAAGGKAADTDFKQGSVVVYFKDRSVSQPPKGRESAGLRWEQLYRVEFVFTKGSEAVYVQMSPPPGIGGMLKEMGGQDGVRSSRPPRPSKSIVPHG